MPEPIVTIDPTITDRSVYIQSVSLYVNYHAALMQLYR